MSDRPVWISGLGTAVPDRVLTNQQIAEGMPWLDTSSRWIEEHVGIRERRIADPEETTTGLALQAARKALDGAGVSPHDIDLLIHATNTGEETFPAGAARVLNGLARDVGVSSLRAGGLDVQQGCASFLGSVRLGIGMIRGGEARVVLVTGADIATRMLDWTDRSTCILLGDGACAAVLVAEEPRPSAQVRLRYLASHMETDPSLADAIRKDSNLPSENDPFRFLSSGAPGTPPANGDGDRDRATDERSRFYGKAGERAFGESYSPFFQMQGRDVYRFVKRTIASRGYMEVLRRAGLVGNGTDALDRRIAELSGLEEVQDHELRRQILGRCSERIDLLIPHQPNLYLLLELAEQMVLPLERVYVNIARYGNTSAASVGLALAEALVEPVRYQTLPRRNASGELVVEEREIVAPRFEVGKRGLLLSFGAGNSWNYVLVEREA